MNNKDSHKDIRRTKDLQSLSQTLLPFAQNILGKNGFVETDIITNWPEIIGEQLAQFSFPQKIDFPKDKKNNGCLHLSVPSGAFAVEIKHKEKYILDKINTYFGYNAVSTLKIIQNNELTISDYYIKHKAPAKLPDISKEDAEFIKNISVNFC